MKLLLVLVSKVLDDDFMHYSRMKLMVIGKVLLSVGGRLWTKKRCYYSFILPKDLMLLVVDEG